MNTNVSPVEVDSALLHSALDEVERICGEMEHWASFRGTPTGDKEKLRSFCQSLRENVDAIRGYTS